MIFDYFNSIFGILKILLFKIIYPARITFKSLPIMDKRFSIAIKQKSKLNIGKKMRTRSNISIRVYDGGNVIIGDNCFFNDGCAISSRKKVVLGNNLICGPNVQFYDNDHDYKNDINNYITEEIVVGKNVWIGANCTILKGVHVGDNCVIAANTLVKESIESNTVVYNEINIKRKKFNEE